MPTDGKTPLTKTETEVIRWWIEKANATKGTKMTTVTEHESMLPVIATLLELPGASPLPEPGLALLRPVNPLIPMATNMEAVDNLRKKGLAIRIMLHRPIMLDVTLAAGSAVAMRDIEVELNAVAKNVIWLNLSDNNFSDIDLKVVKHMANLEKLRIEKNPVSDGVVDLLWDLKQLEAVNLNETLVTDSGLAKLQQHPSLKRIYSWKMPVKQTR